MPQIRRSFIRILMREVYETRWMISIQRYYGKLQLVTVLRNSILIEHNGSKLYFGKMHILTLSRYNKLRDIDAGFGCVYHIITGKCNRLHFPEVRSVIL